MPVVVSVADVIVVPLVVVPDAVVPLVDSVVGGTVTVVVSVPEVVDVGCVVEDVVVASVDTVVPVV